MTEQKAIETLEYIRYCNDYKGCAESIALDIAIKALKLKQNVTNTVGENIEDAYIAIMRKDGVYEINGIDVYESLEKQIPKKPDIEGDGYANGYLVYDTWICPNCETHYEIDYDDYDYCPKCGQAIDKSVMDWSDEE